MGGGGSCRSRGRRGQRGCGGRWVRTVTRSGLIVSRNQEGEDSRERSLPSGPPQAAPVADEGVHVNDAAAETSSPQLGKPVTDLLANKLIEFKFLLQDSTAKLHWQNGPNRSFHTGEAANTLVVFED
ncbi:hypothetical protein U9M48_044168 [Paspalum notatum var. saurae]|uniref:CBM20 domain-containing protein n=1 Tax=Paspalum notatum var. saurae TaxID=547442 RepID=A0AAQ3UWG2_PASNO